MFKIEASLYEEQKKASSGDWPSASCYLQKDKISENSYLNHERSDCNTFEGYPQHETFICYSRHAVIIDTIQTSICTYISISEKQCEFPQDPVLKSSTKSDRMLAMELAL